MKRRRLRQRRWSRADLARLRRFYPNLPARKLKCLFNRTASSLYGTAKKLGLSKSAEYLASPEACRLRRGDQVGAPYRFPPGHVPANKGLRRPGWFAGRMRETQFKKGHRNENHPTRAWKPIGTERVNCYGYLERKVTEEGRGGQRWKAVHILLWVKHPDLPEWGEHEDGTPLLEAMGFDARFVSMEDDGSEDLNELYMSARKEDQYCIAEWVPTPPGPSWLLAGLWDTEDGPVALFVRQQLTFSRVTKVNVERCNRWHQPGGINAWTPERWCTAMMGEAGEVANALKKLFRVEDQIANVSEPGREIQSREQAIEKIAEELADTFLYLNLLACRLGIRLEDEIVAKFNSVSERYSFPERL